MTMKSRPSGQNFIVFLLYWLTYPHDSTPYFWPLFNLVQTLLFAIAWTRLLANIFNLFILHEKYFWIHFRSNKYLKTYFYCRLKKSLSVLWFKFYLKVRPVINLDIFNCISCWMIFNNILIQLLANLNPNLISKLNFLTLTKEYWNRFRLDIRLLFQSYYEKDDWGRQFVSHHQLREFVNNWILNKDYLLVDLPVRVLSYVSNRFQ